jgi:hypothetical protein
MLQPDAHEEREAAVQLHRKHWQCHNHGVRQTAQTDLKTCSFLVPWQVLYMTYVRLLLLASGILVTPQDYAKVEALRIKDKDQALIADDGFGSAEDLADVSIFSCG